MIKNPLMLPVTIYFCIFVQPEWISYFKTFSFLSSNNTPGGVSTCQVLSFFKICNLLNYVVYSSSFYDVYHWLKLQANL